MTQENRMSLSANQTSTISAATSPNCIAKARMNLFLLGCESSGYINKLFGTDLVKKILDLESSPVLSNTRQSVDNITKTQLSHKFPLLKLLLYIASKENDDQLGSQSICSSWLVLQVQLYGRIPSIKPLRGSFTTSVVI